MDAQLHRIIKVFQGEEILAEHEVRPLSAVVLGRSPQANIVVPHNTVSRLHARLSLDEEIAHVEDLGSANGTYVDRRRVEGSVPVRDGQVIQLGQRTAAEPILLRFEDPAAGLLRDMGLVTDEEETDDIDDTKLPAVGDDDSEVAAEGRDEDGEDPDGDDASDEGEGEKGEAGEEGEGAATVAASPDLASERSAFDDLKNPKVLAVIGGMLVVVVVAALALLSILRPAATYWRSIQVTPAQVNAGSQLQLRGPDIRPGGDLVAHLHETPVEELTVERGRLELVAPDVGFEAGGRYKLPLIVHRGDAEIFQQMIDYLVQPEVESLTPQPVRVGDVLEVHGRGFNADLGKLAARFGGTDGSVVAADNHRLLVRVPPVAGAGPVELPLVVTVEGLTPAGSSPLVAVEPRQAQPLPFRFTTDLDPALGRWALRHPLGTAFYVDAPGGGDGGEPADVTRRRENWTAVFEQAALDPNLRLRAQTRDDECAFIAYGGRGFEDGAVLERWTGREFLKSLAIGDLDADARQICRRNVRVWNHFIDVFARGRPTAVDGPAEPYVAVLDELVENNLWVDGDGKPEEADIALLDERQRDILAHVFLRPPDDL